MHADMTLTRFKVKVKVTGLLNLRKLAKPCMHAGGDDRQPPSGAFWLRYDYTDRVDNKMDLGLYFDHKHDEKVC